MVDELSCIAQVLSTPTHLPSMRHTIMKAMSEQLQSDVCVVAATEQPQHRPPLPKLDILAFDADEEPKVQWGPEDDVKGGPLDPHAVQTVRPKEMQYLWDREVYEYATKPEARSRMGRNPVGLKLIDANKGSTDARRYRSRLVCTEVRHKGFEKIFSATPPLEAPRVLHCVLCQEEVFRVEDPPLDFSCRCESSPFFTLIVYVTFLSDCRTRTKDKGARCTGENNEKLCTHPCMPLKR